MKKRKDECQFCTKRSCHNRILRKEPPVYDEVFCYEHMQQAENACDEVLGVGNGILRTYINSTANLRRGDA